MQRKTLTQAVALAGGALTLSATLGAQVNSNGVQEPAAPSMTEAQLPADAASTTEASAPQKHVVSQVRIVRLSLARGVVQMDRNTGRGFEPAFANIPVIAGARLRTGEGVAEVEFEDNSSLRLAPNSEVRFGQLGRMDTGGTETTVDVAKGLVYVGLEKTKGNEFVLTEGRARVLPLPGAHLRLDGSGEQSKLAVFDGVAQLEFGGSSTIVAKRETLSLIPATQTVSTVAKGTEEGNWDGWDKQENDYHKQKASFTGTGGSGLYGANDLNYYGSFVDMPGCGSMWRPYFASAGWSPFASGTWAYYQGAGYSWVSPYPWGWLPFHSGTWASCGGAGWGWSPGNSWYGLNNLTAMRIKGGPLPHPVPPSPVRNAATLVPVNMKELTVSGPAGGGAFAFRRDSAGLGVPRAAFGNLHSFAGHVESQGAVTRSMPVGMVAVGTGGAGPISVGLGARQTGGALTAGHSSSTAGTRSSSVAGQSSNGVAMNAPSSSGMHGGSMSSGGGAATGGSHK